MTTGVVPRIMAAQHADTAFADTHFAQTQMVLANGALRSDEEGDLKVFKARLDALRAAADDPSAMTRDRRRRQAVRGRGREAVRARPARRPRSAPPTSSRAPSTRPPTASPPPSAPTSTAPTASARPPTQRFADAKAGATRLTLIIGALALLVALALAFALSRHLTPPPGRALARRRGARPGRRRPRAVRQGSRRGRAHRRAPWPRWSITSARWPAPPTASPRAT